MTDPGGGLAFGDAGRRYSVTEVTAVPMWAAYLITQNARIEQALARVLELQGVDVSVSQQIESDIAQLIDANTRVVAMLNDQQAKIADLQAKLDAGDNVTAEDLAALDDITKKLVDTANSTATNAAPAPVPETQAPITSPPAEEAPPATDAPADAQTPAATPGEQAPTNADTGTEATADSATVTDSATVNQGSDTTGW
jgi:hypothetical protein